MRTPSISSTAPQTSASVILTPKISGFTIVRNGVNFDYPFIESLSSLLPLVDELVINVGIGEDATLSMIQNFAAQNPEKKIHIFESPWPLNDPEKKKGGQILSEQTNLALDRCTGDWCIYLQADEVLHEDDFEKIKTAICEADQIPQAQALVFEYRHFYGSFDVIQKTRSAYRREVRAIRRSSGARSVGDAQSFRDTQGNKLQALLSEGRIFHYGWVRAPEKMKEKTFFMDQLYHGTPSQKDAASQTPHTGDNYRYKRFWGLQKYTGTHPQVMQQRIGLRGWSWDLNASPMIWSMRDLKKMILDTIENCTGQRLFEYKSYRILGKIRGQSS